MQSNGFFMMFVLFLTCGLSFPQLTASAQGLRVFQFLYFFSSFWNQVGDSHSVVFCRAPVSCRMAMIRPVMLRRILFTDEA
jgi:hypothetical protein